MLSHHVICKRSYKKLLKVGQNYKKKTKKKKGKKKKKNKNKKKLIVING